MGKKYNTKSSDFIHTICKELASSKKSLKEISVEYKVDRSVLSAIVYGRYRPSISSQYDFSARQQTTRARIEGSDVFLKMPTATLEKICNLLKDPNNSVLSIVADTEVSHVLIYKILYKKHPYDKIPLVQNTSFEARFEFMRNRDQRQLEKVKQICEELSRIPKIPIKQIVKNANTNEPYVRLILNRKIEKYQSVIDQYDFSAHLTKGKNTKKKREIYGRQYARESI